MPWSYARPEADGAYSALWSGLDATPISKVQRTAIFEYLEIFHNRQRRHSAIGMHTPIEYETIHRTQQDALLSQVSSLHQTRDRPTRVDRLIRRHVYYGKAQEEAEAWVHSSDQANAQRVVATLDRADVIVTNWGLD